MMKKVMKGLCLAGLGWLGMLLLSVGIRMATSQAAAAPSATTPEPAARQVILTTAATPTPEPAPRPVEIVEYDNDFAELEILARLIWSSPLRDDDQKKVLIWVVLNRVNAGERFGDSIAQVVNTREFTFYDDDAHLSETNLRIADEVLNAWKSERDGHYVGAHVPASGLYIRFTGEQNRAIEVTATKGGEPLSW